MVVDSEDDKVEEEIAQFKNQEQGQTFGIFSA